MKTLAVSHGDCKVIGKESFSGSQRKKGGHENVKLWPGTRLKRWKLGRMLSQIKPLVYRLSLCSELLQIKKKPRFKKSAKDKQFVKDIQLANKDMKKFIVQKKKKGKKHYEDGMPLM